MPKFSVYSLSRLSTCDYRIKDILNEAIKYWDFSVLYGYRGQKEQHEAFMQGNSKVDWPDSRHNQGPPSMAVDIAPYPIDWKDEERFTLFAGAIITIARQKGVNLRWGGDWNRNDITADEHFRDRGHFEIVGD